MASTPIPENLSAVGATGLTQYAGRIYEELLPELRGPRWRRTLRDMLDTDPVIGAVAFAMEMLVRQVAWDVTDAGDDPAQVAAGALIRTALQDMRDTWQVTLAEILSFISWGWADLEITYKRRLGPSRNLARRPSSQYTDGLIGWAAWSIRGQETLLYWDFDDSGDATGFVQLPPPDFRQRQLTFEIDGITKVLHFQTTSRKGNPEGRSIYRGAYRPWYFKRNIEHIEGIGIERDLAGLPVAWVPPEWLDPEAPQAIQATLAAIQKIVINIRRDEQEGVVFPLSYDEQGNKQFDLTLLSSGGARQFDTDRVIQRYNAQIAMVALADFILLGHEKVGSFALASSKTNLFGIALGAFLDHICQVVNTKAIPSLLRLNGMAMEDAPTLTHGDVETIDLEALGIYLQALNAAGADVFGNDTTGAVRAYLYQQGGLPLPPAPETPPDAGGDNADADA